MHLWSRSCLDVPALPGHRPQRRGGDETTGHEFGSFLKKESLINQVRYDQSFLMPISDHPQQLRFDLDLTISMVAERSGISVPTMRSVESGTGSIGSMLGIIDALGGSLTWPGRRTNAALGASLATSRRQVRISQRTLAAMIGVRSRLLVLTWLGSCAPRCGPNIRN